MKQLIVILVFFACCHEKPNKNAINQTEFNKLYESDSIYFTFDFDSLYAINYRTKDTLGVLELTNYDGKLNKIWGNGFYDKNTESRRDTTNDSFWYYAYRDIREELKKWNINRQEDSFFTYVINLLPLKSNGEYSIYDSLIYNKVLQYYERIYKVRGYRTMNLSIPQFLECPLCNSEINYGVVNQKSFKNHVIVKRDSMLRDIYLKNIKSKKSKSNTLYVMFKIVPCCHDFILLKINLNQDEEKIIFQSEELIGLLPTTPVQL